MDIDKRQELLQKASQLNIEVLGEQAEELISLLDEMLGEVLVNEEEYTKFYCCTSSGVVTATFDTFAAAYRNCPAMGYVRRKTPDGDMIFDDQNGCWLYEELEYFDHSGFKQLVLDFNNTDDIVALGTVYSLPETNGHIKEAS
jgi:hypothetical protein